MKTPAMDPAVTFSPATVIVTGGAGFIGSNLVRRLLRGEPDLRVVTLDALTYAGRLDNLGDVTTGHGPNGDGRHYFVKGDVRDRALIRDLLAGQAKDFEGRAVPPADAVLHLAAESHLDRSLLSAAEFVSTNVLGTLVLLEAVRDELNTRSRPFRFVHVSTDEVYGSLEPDDPPSTESAPLRPNSPYAASKAGADCLVRAFRTTYGVPCWITRGSNTYGPLQFAEKLIPLMITRALEELPLPVYGDGLNVRDWLHVDDHADAIWATCRRARSEDDVYNVSAAEPRRNIDVVRAILALLGKPESLIRFVPDRPGHDRRYALDTQLIRAALGWSPLRAFDDGLAETVRWYRDHRDWWLSTRTEAYRMASTLYLRDQS